MTDNEIIKSSEYTKMTDSLEIRKALLEVSHWCTSEYGRLVIQDAIDLINRLTAENGVYETCNARKDETIRKLEAEIERLMQKLQQPQSEFSDIDNLVKEMAEGGGSDA